MSLHPFRQPHYRVRPTANGRWLVVHALPGQPQAEAVDEDCLTRGAAERECAWLEAARDRELRRTADELALCGVRGGATA